MTFPFDHVVVIGSSAGGVTALLQIASRLPPHFPAPICIVQHIGGNNSLLPELLRHGRPNHALHAEHGQRLASGTLHIAPPDHHMLIDGERLYLTHAAKENHARPAIDPLFRTAAATLGPRVIGVILTGMLDDGTAGLRAVHDCGGITVVQDPEDAEQPDMPASAMRNVPVDHCVRLDEIADLLVKLVGVPAKQRQLVVSEALKREVDINRGEANMDNLQAIATPSTLTCPGCGGSLWEVTADKPLRYRCHTGHAYSPQSLGYAQKEKAEEAIWTSMRALRERELLLRRVAAIAAATGEPAQAAAGIAQADQINAQVVILQQLAELSGAVRVEDQPA